MLSALVSSLWLAAQPAPPAFVEGPCLDSRFDGLARCGRVEVPEDWSRPDGRRIGLNVVVIPAVDPEAGMAPLYDLDGGPGLPATKNAAFYLAVGQGYWAHRDIVLIDQRGTGGSSALACPTLAAPEGRYQPMLPPHDVSACRAALESAGADLTRYTTTATVRDMDAVRRALGHDRIDLFALSYGTTVALRYMDEHPGVVRAAVLMGAAPATTRPPSGHAGAAQRVLDLLVADCAADSVCAAAFPDPSGDLDRALARLGAVEGAPEPAVFLERLRSLTYAPFGARRLPFVIRRAAEGDLEPFYAATASQGPELLADGLFLSVICSEAMAGLDYEASVAAAQDTRFGPYRLERQRAACEAWPTAPVDTAFYEPVSSDAAVLFVAGRLDPVTPPELAELAARTLPNSRVVILEHGGHILDGLSAIETCLDPLMLRFYETADAQALDTGCIAQMTPPPFQTEAEAP